MRSVPILAFVAITLNACGDAGHITSAESSANVTAIAAVKAADAATHRYRVTIVNLTSGQPLSPGVLVTHTKKVSLFAAGKTASAGIRAIAEDGNPGVAAAELEGEAGVFDVVATDAPVGRIGGAIFPSLLTTEIRASSNANRLSFSAMLICTNDGFAGLDGVKLPGGFNEVVFYAAAYDSGSEINDEAEGSIVSPCFGIGPVGGFVGGAGHVAEGGTVHMHAGIQQVGDLTLAHAWTGPVARVTVQRIK